MTRLVLVLLTAAAVQAAVPLASAREFAVSGLRTDGAVPAYAGECNLGNMSVAHTYAGWWSGNESYAALVEPEGGDCSCGLGIAVQSVHMSLWLEPGANQLVQCRMLEADDAGAGCRVPGKTLVTSDWIVIRDIESAGVYDIEIPTYFWCAETYDSYFVAVDFLGSGAPGLRLVGGGGAESCRVWNDWGDGWVDLVGSMGFLDNLTIWTDTDCCSAPIAVEPSGWGDLKSSYR
jgi:hypothetical protein